MTKKRSERRASGAVQSTGRRSGKGRSGTPVEEAQAPAPAEPAAPPPSPGDALKPVTGSRSMTWNRHLLDRTRGVIRHWHPGQGEDPKADLHAEMDLTMVALQAFEPTDPVEGMLASQAVALHEASMHCFRLAMVPEQPFEVASKCRKDGANLGRAFADTLDALARHRGKGPQVVRVERVVVNDGGQAIVGPVSAGASLPASASPPQAIGQGAPPMPALDAVPVETGEGEGA